MFHFDRKLITNKNWALLPKASKAIWPVIMCYANEKGESFPSEQTIAILSGLSDKQVREGVRGLEGFPGFEYHEYISKRGRRAKKFKVELPRYEKGKAFPFYQYVLESGAWREAKPSAKALYPVMRAYGYFDVEKYAIQEDLEEWEGSMFEEIYRDRLYDFCEAEKPILTTYAGIDRTSLDGALNSLSHCVLIDENESGWKVFLRTKDNMIFKSDFLNEKIRKAYGNLLK